MTASRNHLESITANPITWEASYLQQFKNFALMQQLDCKCNGCGTEGNPSEIAW